MKNPSGSPFAFVPARVPPRLAPRKRPLQRRSEATVEAVLDATLQVLGRHGPTGLTTTRVASRAGVSVGTVYQYFPHKEALVAALMQRYAGEVARALLDALADARHRAPAEGVRHVVATLLRIKRKNALTSRALRPVVPDRAPFVRASTLALRGAMEELLRAYGVSGDVPRRAALVLAAVEGVLASVVDERPEALEQPWLEDELVRLVLGYVVGPSR